MKGPPKVEPNKTSAPGPIPKKNGINPETIKVSNKKKQTSYY